MPIVRKFVEDFTGKQAERGVDQWSVLQWAQLYRLEFLQAK